MPEVISNTSPLQYLHQLGWLHLLEEFYSQVLATLETLGFHLDEFTHASILKLAGE
jgi:hypothetical protein